LKQEGSIGLIQVSDWERNPSSTLRQSAMHVCHSCSAWIISLTRASASLLHLLLPDVWLSNPSSNLLEDFPWSVLYMKCERRCRMTLEAIDTNETLFFAAFVNLQPRGILSLCMVYHSSASIVSQRSTPVLTKFPDQHFSVVVSA
jgi:hypothetical protein